MRLSAVFVSSAFVLAGMSAALPQESENILARFADSDIFAKVDARAYDEEPEVYAQGDAISTKNHKSPSATSRYCRAEYDNDLVVRGYVLPRDGNGDIPPYTFHFRHSFTPGERTVPGSPGGSRPGSPSTPYVPGSPGSSRPSTPIPYVPGSPGSSRPGSPEWRRVPYSRSHYRRYFYDLD